MQVLKFWQSFQGHLQKPPQKPLVRHPTYVSCLCISILFRSGTALHQLRFIPPLADDKHQITEAEEKSCG